SIFGQFSLLAIPVNLVAIPLLSVVVLGLNLLGLVFWPIWPAVADGFWQLDLWVLAQFHQVLSALVNQWPQALISYRLMGLTLLAASLLVGLWLLPRRVLPLLFSGFLLMPILWPPRADAPLWLRVLDVGQGQSVLIQTAQHQMLWDTGSAYAAERIVLPTLSAYGVRRLDRLVLSAPHQQQMGGMSTLYAQLPIEQVSAGFEEASLPIQPCLAGQTWVWDGVLFEMLAPWVEVTTAALREQSCVLRVTTAPNAAGVQHRVLIMGGAGQWTEQMLLLLCADLKADVLIVGRGRQAADVHFIQAVQPQYSVWSLAKISKATERQLDQVTKQVAEFDGQIDHTLQHGTLSYGLGGIQIVRQAWRDERIWLR
ncbi:MAG: MBL fold metallo-hydrolase, partial [Pseudomonadota bacterium]|nr:MBL fold metallo-hydrolase [Pseudomonadota bacterium]